MNIDRNAYFRYRDSIYRQYLFFRRGRANIAPSRSRVLGASAENSAYRFLSFAGMFCPQFAPEKPANRRGGGFRARPFMPPFRHELSPSRAAAINFSRRGSHSSNTCRGRSFGWLATVYPSTIARGSLRCHRSAAVWNPSPSPQYQKEGNGLVRSPSRPTCPLLRFFRSAADDEASSPPRPRRRDDAKDLGVQ